MCIERCIIGCEGRIRRCDWCIRGCISGLISGLVGLLVGLLKGELEGELGMC